MRYIWFLYEEYFGDNFLKKLVLGPSFAYLRRWDIRSSRRVGYFLAISKTVADRIARIYNREAEVIYPPVDYGFFHPAESSGDFFLIVSALVPYKRVEPGDNRLQPIGVAVEDCRDRTFSRAVEREGRPADPVSRAAGR